MTIHKPTLTRTDREEILLFHIIMSLNESISLNALKICSTLSCPGGTAIYFYTLILPLTYAVYPYCVHCECALMSKFTLLVATSISKFDWKSQYLVLLITKSKTDKKRDSVFPVSVEAIEIPEWQSLVSGTSIALFLFTTLWYNLHWQSQAR